MNALKTLLAGGAAFAALATSTAFASCPQQPAPTPTPGPCVPTTPPAGGPSVINNTQTQKHDAYAWAQMDIVTGGVVTTNAAASGNLAAAQVDNTTANIRNNQDAKASSTAVSEQIIRTRANEASNGAAATGNGLSVSAANANTFVDSLQVARWGETISADARTTIRNVGTSVTTAQAAANNVNGTAAGGAMKTDLLQFSAATVSANAKSEICCADNAVAGSVAAANTTSVLAERTILNQSVRQDNAGGVTAVTDLYVGTAGNATAAAAASGNSTLVGTTFAPANVAANQTNSGAIQANSWLTGGTWSGVGSSSAYAVGNTHDALNTAGNLTSNVTQSNSGQVRAWSAITGGGVGNGSMSLGQSIAIGNSNSATLCTFCGPGALNATNNQVNTGAIEAISRVNLSTSGRAASTAVATGNAASFTVGTPKH